MKLRTVALATLALAASHPAFAGPKEDYEVLREEIWQWQLDRDPLLALQVGDRRGDGKLGSFSLASYDERLAASRAFLARIDAIDAAALPKDLQVDHAIVRRSLADGIEAGGFGQDRFTVISNRFGPQSVLDYLVSGSPLFTKTDYESYVERLEALPSLVEDMTTRSRGAITGKITQSCAAMNGYAATIDGVVPSEIEKSPAWQPFEKKPQTISDADWAVLTVRGRAAIEAKVNPALRGFAAFYRKEYEPGCRKGAPGIGATPGGKAYYDYLVRSFTTTNMSADEVHRLGLSEVARIRTEMEAVAARAGFPSREDFIRHLRTDPQYYAKTPEELMMRNAAIAKQIDGWMPKLFGQLPRTPYTVLPIPDASAPGNTTAYYEPGSLATGQPGVYRVNTTQLDQRPLWEIPALTVHEAVPGHHQQISIQQELEIHPLRRFGTFFTAFVEGWGLYSERLGIEMGLYDTPAKDMGRLSYEMWRASRLVVDTGIHAKGWSKQQAIDYMTANTALSPANIEAEVNRYITGPGQALAYKIGELKIRELRARAERELGERFDLRAFHDAVLENGAVPLDVLEGHVDRWIAARKAG